MQAKNMTQQELQAAYQCMKNIFIQQAEGLTR